MLCEKYPILDHWWFNQIKSISSNMIEYKDGSILKISESTNIDTIINEVEILFKYVTMINDHIKCIGNEGLVEINIFRNKHLIKPIHIYHFVWDNNEIDSKEIVTTYGEIFDAIGWMSEGFYPDSIALTLKKNDDGILWYWYR